MIFCNAIVFGTTRVPILYKRSIYEKASNENLKICKTEVTCFTTCKAQPNGLRILIFLINIKNLSSTNRFNNDLMMIYVSESDIYTK